MKRDYSFNYSGKTGFVVLPRKLLVEAMQNNGNEMTEPQAFVALLLHTNYSDQKTRQGFCPRGESVISIHEWSRIFGWGEWKTRRFFDELIADGIIEFFRDTRPHRLRLVKYEQYCANKS